MNVAQIFDVPSKHSFSSFSICANWIKFVFSETYPKVFWSRFTGMGAQILCPKFFSGHFIFNEVLWVNLFFNQIWLDVWLYIEVASCVFKLLYFNINKALNTKRTSLQTLRRILTWFRKERKLNTNIGKASNFSSLHPT